MNQIKVSLPHFSFRSYSKIYISSKTQYLNTWFLYYHVVKHWIVEKFDNFSLPHQYYQVLFILNNPKTYLKAYYLPGIYGYLLLFQLFIYPISHLIHLIEQILSQILIRECLSYQCYDLPSTYYCINHKLDLLRSEHYILHLDWYEYRLWL